MINKFTKLGPVLTKLISYSDRYNITFHMWHDHYTIVIECEDIVLDFTSSDPIETIQKALDYFKQRELKIYD